MATLHGILAELGIESPKLHPEREVPHAASGWVLDQVFIPEIGNTYELAFACAEVDGNEQYVIKRVRAGGPTVHGWIDLDTGLPLDGAIGQYPVKAYRILG